MAPDQPTCRSDRGSVPDPEAVLWDAVVIGTGMGGATLGHALARSGRRVMFLERGPDLAATAAGVVRGRWAEDDPAFRRLSQTKRRAELRRCGRYADEIEDGTARRQTAFVPQIGSGTGGSTAIYGMVLERFRPSDFEPRSYHAAAADSSITEDWPLSYKDLRPWYTQAERLYRVRGSADPLHPETDDDNLLPPVPLQPEAGRLFACLETHGLHPYRLHLACESVTGCGSCQGYLCPRECKNDAARMCLTPALERHGAALMTECEVIGLDADRTSVRRVVCSWRGRRLRLRARIVVLAAGALGTPELLLRSRSSEWPTGLANGSGVVGRNLMRHCIDLWVLRHAPPVAHADEAKAFGFNDFYVRDGHKLGTVQSFGTTPSLSYLRNQPGINKWRLLGALAAAVWRRYSRAPILASIMEDLPYSHNQVEPIDAQAPAARLRVRYRIGASEMRRRRMLRTHIRDAFSGFGAVLSPGSDPIRALGHVCGTCRFGSDPATSALDRFNRAHGLSNLYVVDGSFFPSSGGINPSLTIAANALRVASHLEERI